MKKATQILSASEVQRLEKLALGLRYSSADELVHAELANIPKELKHEKLKDLTQRGYGHVRLVLIHVRPGQPFQIESFIGTVSGGAFSEKSPFIPRWELPPVSATSNSQALIAKRQTSTNTRNSNK